MVVFCVEHDAESSCDFVSLSPHTWN